MKVTNIILKVVLCLNIVKYCKTFNDHCISHKMFPETATSRTAALKNIEAAMNSTEFITYSDDLSYHN